MHTHTKFCIPHQRVQGLEETHPGCWWLWNFLRNSRSLTAALAVGEGFTLSKLSLSPEDVGFTVGDLGD